MDTYYQILLKSFE